MAAKFPQEIWDLIATHLPVKNALALRAICKQRKDTKVNYPKRLYMHPLQLHNVIAFLTGTSPHVKEARNSIEELVILGISDPAMQQREKRVYAEDGYPVCYPWPDVDGPAEHEPVRIERFRSWEDEYKPLLQALRGEDDEKRLPKLTRLCYQDKVDEEGYWPVSQVSMDSHVRSNRILTPLAFAWDWSELRRNRTYTQWSDNETIYGIIVYSGLSFTSLRIDQPCSGIETLRWPWIGNTEMEMSRLLSRAFDTVTHLTFTVPGPPEYAVLIRFILHARQLRSLTINVKTPLDDQWNALVAGTSVTIVDWGIRDIALTLERLLERHEGGELLHPRLEELNIFGHSKTAERWIARRIRRVLNHHKLTLKVVRFRNVIFCGASGTRRAMKAVVQALVDCQLRTAELSVPCLDIDPGYRETGALHEFRLARRYQDDERKWFGRGVFDCLAAKLGVTERNGWWDFAGS